MDHGFFVDIIDQAIPLRVENKSRLLEAIQDSPRVMIAHGGVCRYFDLFEIDSAKSSLEENFLKLYPRTREQIQVGFIGDLKKMKSIKVEKEDYPLAKHEGVYVAFWPQDICGVYLNEKGARTFKLGTCKPPSRKYHEASKYIPNQGFSQSSYLFNDDLIRKQFSAWALDIINIQPRFIQAETPEKIALFRRLVK